MLGGDAVAAALIHAFVPAWALGGILSMSLTEGDLQSVLLALGVFILGAFVTGLRQLVVLVMRMTRWYGRRWAGRWIQSRSDEELTQAEIDAILDGRDT